MPWCKYRPTVKVSATIAADTETLYEQTECALLCLPNEVLLHVFSWLEAGHLRRSVAVTCRRLYCLLNDEAFWRWRRAKTHPFSYYPSFMVNNKDFCWWRACASLDCERQRWSRYQTISGQKCQPDFLLTHVHYGTVDALHLFSGTSDNVSSPLLCASGSRDRNLIVWDLNKLTRVPDGSNQADSDVLKSCRVCSASPAHDGWIWSIASESSEKLITSGWDNRVKWWQLRPDARLEETAVCKLPAPVLRVLPFSCDLSSSSEAGTSCQQSAVVVASRFDHTVSMLDNRIGDESKVVAEWKCHRGSVLDLAQASESRVFSCADDRSLVCVDVRVGKPLASRSLPQYATSLSYGNGCLWASTNKGYICLVNPERESLPTVVGPGLPLVCVSGPDRCVHVLPFGRRPQPPLARFSGFSADPVRVDYERGGGALVCGMSDGSISVWKRAPVHEQREQSQL